MKKLMFASVSLMALAAMQPAASADPKPPASKPFVDPWNWSGGYIGANMGDRRKVIATCNVTL